MSNEEQPRRQPPGEGDGINRPVGEDAAACATAIVSGEDTHPDYSSSSDDDFDFEDNDNATGISNKVKHCGDHLHHNEGGKDGDELYCDNVDDEDEAWVYRNLRGGREEIVSIRRRPAKSEAATNVSPEKAKSGANIDAENNSSSRDDGKTAADSGSGSATPEQIRMLKPRNSDAILSCPCCFNIVCMDCQQHERYLNQYRAMFVMNIGVRWDTQIAYDEHSQELRPRVIIEHQRGMPSSSSSANGGTASPPDKVPHEDEEYYYSVYCLHCKTDVAALNMDDEVYHFFGCVASG